MPSPAHAQRSLQRATTRPPLHAPSSSAEPPAPVLVAPTVKRRLAHVKGPDNLTDHPPGRMHRVCFAMLRHDLLRPISGSLHLRESPGPSLSPSELSWQLDQDLGGRPAPPRPADRARWSRCNVYEPRDEQWLAGRRESCCQRGGSHEPRPAQLSVVPACLLRTVASRPAPTHAARSSAWVVQLSAS